MGHYSYPLSDKRERQLEKLVDATGATNKSDALDIAIGHYLQDMRNREEYWDQIPPETLKLLDTDYLKVSFYPKVKA